jgi:hypothetical protein
MKFNSIFIDKIGKARFVLYLFSYEIFIITYNIIDNISNLIFRQKVYFNFISFHYGGCSDRETLTYIFSTLFLKFIIFFVFAYGLNKGKIKTDSLLFELLVSFFLFDIVSFFALCIDKLALIKFHFHNYFIANSDVIFHYYLHNSVFLISAFWSVLLLLLLKKHNKLNIKFLVTRLSLVSLSIISLIIFLSVALRLYTAFIK